MNPLHSYNVSISQSDLVAATTVAQFYSLAHIQNVLSTTLAYMSSKVGSGTVLPYFTELDSEAWTAKPKALEVYVTDLVEARALNLEARGKDYATNILSYPSELPSFILAEMPTIALGELIICHDVVVQQANEQNKIVADHATHLLVHGILHLLGFDHELSEAEADEMEGFEIEILQKLDIKNPYSM